MNQHSVRRTSVAAQSHADAIRSRVASAYGTARPIAKSASQQSVLAVKCAGTYVATFLRALVAR